MQNYFIKCKRNRDEAKQKKIFAYLRDQKAKICFLQETYSKLNDEVTWQSEWGGNIFFSHGTFSLNNVVEFSLPTNQEELF